jgi:hypothetical protein
MSTCQTAGKGRGGDLRRCEEAAVQVRGEEEAEQGGLLPNDAAVKRNLAAFAICVALVMRQVHRLDVACAMGSME